ncbi:hypothetical protein GF340_03305 [Candidatus Peregrinibacteria bacterium]|nr:hypothetical protein [Candidatus Peregrinibacteria bacterium]
MRVLRDIKSIYNFIYYIIIKEHLQSLMLDSISKKLFWTLPDDSLNIFKELFEIFAVKSVLEIGTSIGNSSSKFAKWVGDDGLVVTVESHDERFEMARKRFADEGVEERLIQIKGHAPEVFDGDHVKEILINGQSVEIGRQVFKPEMFDFVFLDATKMEYLKYLEKVLPLTKNGGLIVADNCTTHSQALNEFIEKTMNHPDLNSYLLEIDNGLLLSFIKR